MTADVQCQIELETSLIHRMMSQFNHPEQGHLCCSSVTSQYLCCPPERTLDTTSNLLPSSKAELSVTYHGNAEMHLLYSKPPGHRMLATRKQAGSEMSCIESAHPHCTTLNGRELTIRLSVSNETRILWRVSGSQPRFSTC